VTEKEEIKMTQSNWNATDIPDQTGKVAIVTGANSGLGFEIVRGLARKNARVVLACRDAARGGKALEAVRREFPGAQIELIPLDLADLDSIQQFVETFKLRYSRLDILCNNAGVMAIPYRQTKQGFEMQFGTNHLGHFALTGLLLPVILATPGQPRIVTTSSGLHKSGDLNFADLEWKQNYKPGKAYSRSKLSNLLFTYELQDRLKTEGDNVLSLAAHPGYAATNLQTVGAIMEGSAFKERAYLLANRWIAQTAEMGALPSLYAATAPGLQGGEYIGPGGFMELHGYPRIVDSNKKSHDRELAKKLWAVSEELTGVSFSKNLVSHP
jgi:NAD(P)-dependent dehydrogenase (short-subunit alcohol dehydrogenase family)